MNIRDKADQLYQMLYTRFGGSDKFTVNEEKLKEIREEVESED